MDILHPFGVGVRPIDYIIRENVYYLHYDVRHGRTIDIKDDAIVVEQ